MIQQDAFESRPLVLIVEDEEPIAQALAYVVVDAGYRTLIATDGKAALALELTHRPALIITDLMMPRMNGRDLIAALRATDDHATPPVVLMTAAGALRRTSAPTRRCPSRSTSAMSRRSSPVSSAICDRTPRRILPGMHPGASQREVSDNQQQRGQQQCRSGRTY
jgi:two-component system, OmpR family, response regulator VicR